VEDISQKRVEKEGTLQMKRILLIPLALVATLVVVAAAGADTKTVQIVKSGFTPSATTVTVGDSVTWRNADTVNHQVVANDGSFASPVLKPGDSFSQTFSKAEKLSYHDSLFTSKKGTVTVNAPAASVTLQAGASTIVYGNSTMVSGAVTNQLTNEPVTLTSQPYGKGTQSIATTMTSANGAFSFPVSPTIQTSYQAHWRTVGSSSVSVNVAPRVGFGQSGRLYTAKVTSDIGYGGHYVWVQRKAPYGSFRNVKRIYLGSASRAVFRVTIPKGRSVLRLVLPADQAGAGYVQGLSRLIAVKRG
jgi:plastocyanin